jgi:hypothetical protein
MDLVSWGAFIVLVSTGLAIVVAWSDELRDRNKRK